MKNDEREAILNDLQKALEKFQKSIIDALENHAERTERICIEAAQRAAKSSGKEEIANALDRRLEFEMFKSTIDLSKFFLAKSVSSNTFEDWSEETVKEHSERALRMTEHFLSDASGVMDVLLGK